MTLTDLNEAVKNALKWRAALWKSETAIGVLFRILDVCSDVAAVDAPCSTFEGIADDRCNDCDECDRRNAILYRYRQPKTPSKLLARLKRGTW